ncbi:DNA-directed RNA polymerase specialized sigma24 family protein [Chitinophaga terrae (ex Kim and Jung 2007)]|uniref:hypothetical protein n=1 Tax=Chitinophaga terrae (ex Kim and Jung 2007) TaxID=408074 RepID=UPI002781D689|nr:hypothetical protein [Chitinophaga terrae (ex Kim and Jung 2007)]MDQ0107491.1 DNA-directed RNA polymerase specialized sigma24 family protein [Chitinophaga terrae (ex Kim and Jung 2007)]
MTQNRMQSPNDALLLKELKAGSEEAFVAIFNRYCTRLQLEAHYILRDAKQANDVTNDVFTDFWSQRSKLPNQLSLKHYLLSAIRNRCMDIKKRSAAS